MTRLSMVLLVFLFSFLFLAPPLAAARKLTNIQQTEALSLNNDAVVSVEQREPKPAFSFSNKGHEMVNKERFLALHLAKLDRILQSIPSPGAGH
ncbi:C-TERMINALLY ENCODED PEPTIDE 14 [Hibiscus trionum]|uniref:C-TERMINALLY ENCODED PEPTIDE 14 n=1 Tax=Hibiscus trionum TaxID=183268 RepID=A0A9W7JC16_HIBTR|nr:C-TERMINALLY ENCODED PEPTIDE 14 [Hibiscus trionum]